MLSRFAAVIQSWPQQIITSGANSVDLFPISTPPTLAGLFFCLASAEGARLLFCLATIQPHTSVYSAFCISYANYTAHATKPRAGLYRCFSCDCTYLIITDTRPTQAAIMPPAPRWSAYQRPDALHRYQIPPPRRTLYRSAQQPYYNKVYKGATVQPGTIHPAGQSSSSGAAGGAEPLAALAASLFRAFAR